MSSLRKIVVMAAADVRGLVGDRQGAFFTFALPVAVILLIGLVVTGQNARLHVGVTAEGHGPLTTQLVKSLQGAKTVTVSTYHSRSALDVAVRRGDVNAGIDVPADYDRQLVAGGDAPVAFMGLSSNPSVPAYRTVVDALVTRQAAVAAAARLASARTGVSFDKALAQARSIQRADPAQAQVSLDPNSGAAFPGGFRYTAPTNLVLFMFVNALGAAGAVAWMRKLGVVRRMLGTPTSPTTVLLGLGAGRFAIVLMQALFIILIGSLVFGVPWGDPVALGAVVLVFGLLSTGAAMLVAARARGLEQTIAVAAPLGIALGMLGGCMWPLAIVGGSMRALGHLTPHAWAVDALMALTVNHAGLGGIAADLGVLLLFAVALLALGSWQLRRALTVT